MKLERMLNEASQALHQELELREIPPPPIGDRIVGTNSRRYLALASAAAVAVVALTLSIYVNRDPAEVVVAGPSAEFILPLDDVSEWTYEVTDLLETSALGSVTVQASQYQVGLGGDGRIGLPFSLLEPWREPSECADTQRLTLPTATQLQSAGSSAQEVRSVCGENTMVGAARLSWQLPESISVPAGVYEAVRIDVEITGFVDPFPMTLSLFVDPTVGIVRQEVVGSPSQPSRHVRADLVSFVETVN